MLIEVILLGYLDRLRGSDLRVVSGDARLVMGLVVAAITGHPFDLLTIPIAVLFAIGEAPGWAAPLNMIVYRKKKKEPEKWQIGPLEDLPVLSAFVRGFMWGAPLLLLTPFDVDLGIVPVAMAIAMPVAALLSFRTHHFHRKWLNESLWQRMEFLRGLLFGALILLFGAAL